MFEIYFNIHWTDLTFEKQQEIEDMVRERIMEDEELINECREEARDDERREREWHKDFCKQFPKLTKPYKPTPIKDRLEVYIEKAIDKYIDENFIAKGEI